MKLHNLQAEFIRGSSGKEHFPDLGMPEIAFSGRSNVGKSSLINSIVERKNLAHTSSAPGKTREINFYVVESKWSFADLPGFGYAAIGKKYRQKWSELNYEYLGGRKSLRMVCALVDSRHDPQDSDLALIEWLENNAKQYIIILTKCDKISKIAVAERKKQLEHLVSNCRYNIEVLPYSSVSGTGRQELLAIIKKVCVLED
ncbi:MAG: ribosome biogenesis GTP-binding protein YihA/YsxC [Bacteroidota bacterium]